MRPLRQILTADAALARWTERQQRDRAVLQLIKRELPQALAAHVGAASAEAQELILVATSGAAAALLRQRIPPLQTALEHSGMKFTVIRVRVQARSARTKAEKILAKQMDPMTAARLKARARKLTDPALRDALTRLASAGGRRLPDDDPAGEEPDE